MQSYLCALSPGGANERKALSGTDLINPTEE